MEAGAKFIWVALKAEEKNLVFLMFDSVMRQFVSIIPFRKKVMPQMSVHER